MVVHGCEVVCIISFDIFLSLFVLCFIVACEWVILVCVVSDIL